MVRSGGPPAPIVVTIVEVLFELPVSPAIATVAVFVTVAGAPAGIPAVMVIVGNDAPPASEVERVHVITWPLTPQFHPSPAADGFVSGTGTSSVTVTVPLLAVVPA